VGGGPLGGGIWDFWITLDLDGIPVSGRLSRGADEPPPIRYAPVKGFVPPMAKLYYTEFWEKVSLHVGASKPVPKVVVDSATVSRGRLSIRGRLPAGGPVTVRILARNRTDGRSRAAMARLAGDVFGATFGLRDWQDGRWDLSYEIVGGDGVARGRLTPGQLGIGGVSLWRLAIPYQTRTGELSVQMTTRPLLRRAAKRLGVAR
jgi:hypothetical protein